MASVRVLAFVGVAFLGSLASAQDFDTVKTPNGLQIGETKSITAMEVVL